MSAAAADRPLPAFDRFCRWLATAGGFILLVAAIVTVVSVLGRYFLNAPIPGDIEIGGFLMAAAIALFLPECQLRKGNVIVDVFTVAAPVKMQAALDAVASLTVAVAAAVIAWRMGIGMVELRAARDETMVLRLPTWIGFIVVVPSLVLLAVASLIAAWRDAGIFRRSGASQ
ncbi:MAG TPA: TRAP transporter small permease [Ferrovibrio sp.]|uniref:TRAP transporter small permease n=1 Tax=Ferrovibrio sp. TaxID=1917215 RepID=UPI002B4B4163|nr:TRAP transporter small permease [Ferrovibrio sp.]HLT79064.1 TRAP transporter small permease [Ferrovibrio sp.]